MATQEANLEAARETRRVFSQSRLRRTVTCFAASLVALACALPAAAATSSRYDRHARAYRVKTLVPLAGYRDANPAALGAGGSIAGDADLNGARRCLLFSGGVLSDITPANWTDCWVSAMSSNGTIVGTVRNEAVSAGFLYRAGRAYAFADAAAFRAIDASSQVLAVKRDGSTGVYDPQSDAWQTFSDAASGCTLNRPLALNDRFVFGATTCAGGAEGYALAAAGRVVPVTLPVGLSPTTILNQADQLVLIDPASGGHPYLWSPLAGRAPIDLGECPGVQYGPYTPVAANSHGTVVGRNDPLFFSWVRTPADGMRDLDNFVPKTLFDVVVGDVDENGNLLARGFDFASDSQVWLILQPV